MTLVTRDWTSSQRRGTDKLNSDLQASFLSPSNESLTVQNHPTTPSSTARRQVLVVEDEEILRDEIGMLLEESGYAISLAGNGREALMRLSTEEPPNVIILDLKMPVMDGWEFRTAQQNDHTLSGIPVIAISADRSPKAAAISADAYLRKPFDAKALLGTVSRVLLENERQLSGQRSATEHFSELGEIVAKLGHDINNPLTIVLLNLNHSLEQLRSSIGALAAPLGATLTASELAEVQVRLMEITEMLEDCQVSGERIQGAIASLHQVVYAREANQ